MTIETPKTQERVCITQVGMILVPYVVTATNWIYRRIHLLHNLPRTDEEESFYHCSKGLVGFVYRQGYGIPDPIVVTEFGEGLLDRIDFGMIESYEAFVLARRFPVLRSTLRDCITDPADALDWWGTFVEDWDTMIEIVKEHAYFSYCWATLYGDGDILEPYINQDPEYAEAWKEHKWRVSLAQAKKQAQAKGR